MFVLNDIGNATAFQQTRDHRQFAHVLRLSETDHRHAVHSTLKPAIGS
jgi:hypothetical protein